MIAAARYVTGRPAGATWPKVKPGQDPELTPAGALARISLLEAKVEELQEVVADLALAALRDRGDFADGPKQPLEASLAAEALTSSHDSETATARQYARDSVDNYLRERRR